ncbi:hypothetical protein V7S43_013353 [Phytophthora oleae]|uniref:Uncharacterized protein n=1 Tax=Phytophthora oleae TaxID=2107226 RepID=A0ABD3F451_9STRA
MEIQQAHHHLHGVAANLQGEAELQRKQSMALEGQAVGQQRELAELQERLAREREELAAHHAHQVQIAQAKEASLAKAREQVQKERQRQQEHERHLVSQAQRVNRARDEVTRAQLDAKMSEENIRRLVAEAEERGFKLL